MIKLPRDYGTAILLAALSAVMSLVLVGEWFHFRSVRQELSHRSASTGTVANDAEEAPAVEPKTPPLESFDEMTNRPLFLQGRRPPVEDEQEEVAEAPEPKTPLNAKLMGVVLTPSGKTALFVDAQGKYKRARKGTAVDGWKVVEIKEDRVTLEQAGEKKDVMLIKPKPKAPAAAQGAKKSGKAVVTGPGQSSASDEDSEDSGDEAGDDTEMSDEDESDTTDEEDAESDESGNDE
jgi:type II secretory pathway component PulC